MLLKFLDKYRENYNKLYNYYEEFDSEIPITFK